MKTQNTDKKNVVFFIAVASKHKYLNDKHGGFKYFEFSTSAWKYWCDKHDVEFFIYDTQKILNMFYINRHGRDGLMYSIS